MTTVAEADLQAAEADGVPRICFPVALKQHQEARFNVVVVDHHIFLLPAQANKYTAVT